MKRNNWQLAEFSAVLSTGLSLTGHGVGTKSPDYYETFLVAREKVLLGFDGSNWKLIK